MKKIELYTDGACSGNPGPGGWGAVLVFGPHEKELSGFEASTTNNRMELTAVIRGLAELTEPCDVTVTSDSRYVVDSVTKRWVYAWRAHGWKNSQKVEPPNRDLWEQLLALLDLHTVRFNWIRGHAGHPYNERCDRLAVAEYTRSRS